MKSSISYKGAVYVSSAMRKDPDEGNAKVRDLKEKSKIVDNLSSLLMGGTKEADYKEALRAFKAAKSSGVIGDKSLLVELQFYFESWEAHIEKEESLDKLTDKLRDKLDKIFFAFDKAIEKAKSEPDKAWKKLTKKDIKPKDMPF